MYSAEQVKTAKVNAGGLVMFGASGGHLTVGKILQMINSDLILICIGLDCLSNLVKVWLFDKSCTETLNKFNANQLFAPTLCPKQKSNNEFSVTMRSSNFCFDLTKGESEITRLQQARKKAFDQSVKNTLHYLNENDSQIPSHSNRVELVSFNLVRKACQFAEGQIERDPNDSGSKVDFRLNKVCRIQDKTLVIKKYTNEFNMRSPGGNPYNPDEIDIFQITNIKEKIVWAIPMRKLYTNTNETVSTFSVKELMNLTSSLSVEWKKKYQQYSYDLKVHKDVEKYIEHCMNAARTGNLHNQTFYQDALKNNAHLIGSKKMLKRKSSSQTESTPIQRQRAS